MAHGAPDDSNVVSIAPRITVSDMAELAVRLGATSSCDRWGRVAFRDSFDCGTGDWTGWVNTSEHKATLLAQGARSGGYCASLWWDGAAYTEVALLMLRDWAIESKVGVEMYFHPRSNVLQYGFSGSFYSGATKYFFAIRWDTVDDVIEVLNAANQLETVQDVVYTYGLPRTWRALKIVMDPIAAEYVRGQWGPLTFNARGIALRTLTSQVEPHITMFAYGSGEAGSSGEIWLDDFILTVDEP